MFAGLDRAANTACRLTVLEQCWISYKLSAIWRKASLVKGILLAVIVNNYYLYLLLAERQGYRSHNPRIQGAPTYTGLRLPHNSGF